jgi:hypothetical protein
MLSDKEVIVLEDSCDGEEESAIVSIIKQALEKGAADPEKSRIRFNDFTTADMVVRVLPDGPSLFLNTSIVHINPVFASFQNFAEAKGYADIKTPDPETCAFVIECLYIFSADKRVVKKDEYASLDCAEFFIKRKFV